MKPEIVAEEVIAKSRIFEIRSIALKFSNGNERLFERLNSHREAVLMVPMQDPDTVLLTKEYAVGVDRYEWGLPKGLVEPNETYQEAADRELMEEVGMSAKTITLLKTFTLAPGYMNHTTHIMLAEDLSPQTSEGDEPEPIEVMSWPMDKLSQLFQRPDCSEARSIAALLLARDFIKAREWCR